MIERHADAEFRPVAESFAMQLMTIPGVVPKLQKSKTSPSYFQVRHRAQNWVVAYVQPRLTLMSVLYRLGNNHDTKGRPTTRFTGPRVRLSSMADPPVAIELVNEAIAKAHPEP